MLIFDLASYSLDLTNYYFWVGLITAIVSLLSGFYVWSRSWHNQAHSSFFLFSVAIVLWATPYALWQSAVNAETALFWCRGLMVGAILTTVTLPNFMMQVSGATPIRWRIIRIITVLTAIFLVSNLTPAFVNRVEPIAGFDFWPKPGWVFHIFLFTWIIGFAISFGWLYGAIRQSVGVKRRRLQLLMVGFGVAILGGGSNYLPWYGIPAPPYLGVLVGAYVIMAAYAMARYGLFPVSLRTAAGTILESVPDALFVLQKGKVVRANLAAERMIGLSKDQLVGRRLEEYVPGFADYAKVHLGAGTATGSPVPAAPKTVIGRGGEAIRVSVSVSTIPDTDNGLIAVCHDLRPITAAFDRMEQAKRQAERQHHNLKTVIETLDEGLVLIGLDGRVELINQAGAALADLEPSNCIGKPFTELFDLKEEGGTADASGFIWGSMFKSRRSAGSATAELKRASGRLPVRSVSYPIYLDGSAVGAVVSLEDDTLRRQESRRKDETVSVAVHQLKTPLGIIRWYLDALLAGNFGPVEKKQGQALKDLHEVSLQMIGLVNSLLNISRIERGVLAVSPEPTDLLALCRSLVDQLQHEADQKQLGLQLAGDFKELTPLDPVLVREAVRNLLTNAIKYTPEGGQVEVTVKQDGDSAVVAVQDNGIGISPEDQEHVFDKFFRASNAIAGGASGNGLGLYLTKQVIEGCGGQVGLSSDGNQGSSFWISLPLSGMAASEGDRQLAL